MIGVDVEDQGGVGVEMVWNGSSWIPNFTELRRMLIREAMDRTDADGYALEDDEE